eukprot:TRINITY_DN5610_c0_g1_i4.p2 TRINITY_DN5610_c0_g1~~TRINITY_DN5610_c0_g1_i4.p2  ORF type:complete len:224 (+),score=5.09 TRINITY_DN5610_c0_g1_i4:363-1034(+)
MVYACGPTALSTGVAFTQVLGGNVPLALLMVIISNIVAVFTIPYWIPTCFHVNGHTDMLQLFDPVKQIKTLILMIVIPLICGMILRIPVRNVVQQHRKSFSNLNAICLAIFMWVQIGKCMAQKYPIKVIDGIIGGGISIIQHGLFLIVNYILVRFMILRQYDYKVWQVVTMVSSQKALQVCVVVLAQLTQMGIIANQPLYLLIPVIAYSVTVHDLVSRQQINQ